MARTRILGHMATSEIIEAILLHREHPGLIALDLAAADLGVSRRTILDELAVRPEFMTALAALMEVAP